VCNFPVKTTDFFQYRVAGLSSSALSDTSSPFNSSPLRYPFSRPNILVSSSTLLSYFPFSCTMKKTLEFRTCDTRRKPLYYWSSLVSIPFLSLFVICELVSRIFYIFSFDLPFSKLRFYLYLNPYPISLSLPLSLFIGYTTKTRAYFDS